MALYCSSCGAAAFTSSAAFCTKCGSRLVHVPAPQPPTVPTQRAFAPSATPVHLIVRLPKSVGVAVVLSILFGPFGLFYATVKGGLIMLATEILAGLFIFFFIIAAGSSSDPNAPVVALFGGLALLWLFAFVIHIACVLWAVLAAQSYNREIHLRAVRG